MGLLAKHTPRREARVRQKLNLVLIMKSERGQKEQPATTVDVTEHGLRIATRLHLNEGQIVYAFPRQGGYRFGNCRVVWINEERKKQLAEAGLEVIK